MTFLRQHSILNLSKKRIMKNKHNEHKNNEIKTNNRNICFIFIIFHVQNTLFENMKLRT